MTPITDQTVPLSARQGQISELIRPSIGQLPLAGKSILIIEDEALISMGVESCLRDAGAADVKITNSVAFAQRALDEGNLFDGAVVDLHVADGDASPLVQILSERGIPVVITTGYDVDWRQPPLGRAIAILRKPHTDSDLINALWRAIN
jgi:DNA-binding NtrC family response regulator